jgi:predicted MFS family arabinose efflux permease
MSDMRISHEEFSMLVSIPSITGVLCGAVAGMVSLYGSTLTALVTALLAFIGEIIIAYGIENSSFRTIMFGRILFVLCWNLLGSVQKVIIFRQFTGPALAFIFALKIIAIRIGAVSGLYFAGTILSQVNGELPAAMFYAVIISGISLICTTAFAYLYRGSSAARMIRPLMIGHRRNRQPDDSSSGFSLNIPRDSWICCGIIFLYYGGLVPFETFGVDYLVTSYGLSRTDAGQALALIPFFSFFSFILSPVMTNLKRQLFALIVATGLVALSITLEMWNAPYAPHLYLCLIGLGHMVVANAVWLALAGVSQTETQKTNAAAISSAIYAVSTFTFNWMTGKVRDVSGDYDSVLSVLSGLILAGSILSVYLLGWGRWVDRTDPNQELLLEGGVVGSPRLSVPRAPSNPPVIDENHFSISS